MACCKMLNSPYYGEITSDIFDFTAKFLQKRNCDEFAERYKHVALTHKEAQNIVTYKDYIEYGEIKLKLKKYEEALGRYNSALKIIQNIKNNKGIDTVGLDLGECYHKIAHIYSKLGDDEKALPNYIDGYMEIINFFKINNPERVPRQYIFISYIYEDLLCYEKAIEYNNIAKKFILENRLLKTEDGKSEIRDCNLFNALYSFKSKHPIQAFKYFCLWLLRICK